MSDGEDHERKWYELLLALPLCIYLLLPTYNYYWDGISFAINIEKHLPVAFLVHPSHLIYTLWGAWLFHLTELAGIHTRALFVMQTANSVLAGLCVILLYVCLRRSDVPRTLSVAWALVFGFSATWWRFATDANAYVPSIFLLLFAYLLLERPKATIFAGLLTAGAMLFHELAILFVPVALVLINKRRLSMWMYSVSALVPVAAAYLVAFGTVSDHQTLFAWITSHSSDSGFYFNPFTNLAMSIRGSFRLFFGGKLSDFTGDGISLAVLVLFVIALLAFFVYSWRARRAGSQDAVPSRRSPTVILTWIGVYIAFLFFWMPQNTFYRLFYLPPLILLLALILRDTPASRSVVWLLVPVMALWNFAFLIYPQARPEFNVPLRFALAQQKTWSPGTPIVFHMFHPDLWTISYFNPQVAWIGLDQPDLDQLARNLEYARSEKKPLWLEQTAYDLLAANPDGQHWLARHESMSELFEFRTDKHEFRFHRVR